MVHIDELLVSIGNTQQIDFAASSTVDFTGTSAIVMDGGSVTIKALDQVSGNGGASSVTAGKTTAAAADGGDTSVAGGASAHGTTSGLGGDVSILGEPPNQKLVDLSRYFQVLVPRLVVVQ